MNLQKILKAFLPRKTTLSILEKICVRDGRAYATDLQSSLEVKLDKKMKDGLYDGKLFVQTGQWILRDKDINEYPNFPKPSKEVDIPVDLFQTLTKYPFTKYVAVETTRGVLKCVLFGKDFITATNGHIMIFLGGETGIKNPFALPREAAYNFSVLFNEDSKLRSASWWKEKTGTPYVQIKGNGWKVTARLNESELPDVKNCFPLHYNNKSVVKADDLKILKTDFESLYPFTDTRTRRFYFLKNDRLFANGEGVDKTIKTINNPYGRTISFNADYFKQILSDLVKMGKDVKVKSVFPEGATVYLCDGVTFLLMPLRITDNKIEK